MQKHQEIEVKFYLKDLTGLETRLQQLDAVLIQPRTHEYNLRFDTPDGELTRTFQVLRLRQDERVRLTYKRRADVESGPVSSRQEIEFEASSFEDARLFLEALGYQVSMIYEKYRRTYRLGELEVMLDETPIGDFIEIEGPDAESIQSLAADLHLNWHARSLAGYMMLLDRIKAFHKGIRHLTFEDFAARHASPQEMGLIPADA